MSDDEKAEAKAASPGSGAAGDSADVVAILREIRDIQHEASDRQGRFLWLLIPIFAVLCVQVVLLLLR